MAWKVVEHDGWVETFPVDDANEHDHAVYMDAMPFGEDALYSKCKCKPRIEKENGIFLVHHSSFDGREGVEWANEILNK